MEPTTTASEVAETIDLGTVTARKRGRNPRFPYVIVIDHGDRTKQVLGSAFATAEEAVQNGRRILATQRADLARRLADPRNRALRRHYGLPEEASYT